MIGDITPRWRTPIPMGVATSLLQLWICLLAGGHSTLGASYRGFTHWDGHWYESILRNGYISAIPPRKMQWDSSNVAFFPGYPAWAWLIEKATLLETHVAMALASQLMAVSFWILFFVLIARISRSLLVLLLAGFLVIIHPAAFYLQAGYSESLFLTTLLAFFMTALDRKQSWLVAGGIGTIMTATRIVGVPLAFLGVLPRLTKLLRSRKRENLRPQVRDLIRSLLIGGISLIGIGAFFAFCWMKWGRWDLYFWSQQIGWSIYPDYLTVFRPRTWWQWQAAEDLSPLRVDPNQFSQVMTSAYLWLLMGTVQIEAWARDYGVKGLRGRLPFYLAATLMMYVSVSGLASVKFQSMTRYTFPVHVCWLIAFLELYLALPRKLRLLRYSLIALALALGAYSLVIQFRFINMFMNYKWVA